MASTDKKSNVVLTQVAAYLMTVFPLCIYQGLLCCMACLCVKKKKEWGKGGNIWLASVSECLQNFFSSDSESFD